MADARWRIDPPCAPGSLAQFRQWVDSWMQVRGIRAVDPDDVALALTELVTNSIQYAAGPVEVALFWDGDRLRAEVSDASATEPAWPPFERRAESGRGLLILDRLATRWGVIAQPAPGKTVWCEFVPAPSERMGG